MGMPMPSTVHATRLVVPTVLAALLLGACSLLTSRTSSSPSGGEPNPASAPAASESPYQAAARQRREIGERVCARTAEAAGITWPDDTKHSRTARMRYFREIIAAAPRAQFVSVTTPTFASYQEGSDQYTRTIPAGEPLLLLSCTWKELTGGREYQSAQLLAMDGVLETTINLLTIERPDAAAAYDLEPAAFVFDPASIVGTPRDASASVIYNEGHPDDRAKAPTLESLHKQAGECALKATGACMAAEQEVAAGPWRADLEAAKDRACAAAVKRERGKCMKAADAKTYDKLIDELWAQSRAREQAYLAGLVEKFQ